MNYTILFITDGFAISSPLYQGFQWLVYYVVYSDITSLITLIISHFYKRFVFTSNIA